MRKTSFRGGPGGIAAHAPSRDAARLPAPRAKCKLRLLSDQLTTLMIHLLQIQEPGYVIGITADHLLGG